MPVNLDFRQFHDISAQALETDVLGVSPGNSRLSLVTGKKEATLPEECQRAWTALNDAAKQHYGAARVERVWKYYRIDPAEMMRKNRPLKVGHVHMLEVGAMKLRIGDLHNRIGGVPVEHCHPVAIANSVEDLNRYTADPLKLPPHEIRGSPSHTIPFFSYDPYLMDQELQLLFRDVGKLKRNAYLERLTKAIVSRELPEGTLIPAPSPTKSGITEYYVVYKCISKGDGLVAYALKPVTTKSRLKPMVVFRPSPYHPSGLDFLETWLNNMQKNMGWLGYQTARGALGNLLYDPDFCSLETPITVCGYSLGGVHAQLLTADYYDRIGEAIFFNDPSIDADTAEMFAVKINALTHLNHPMRVRIYRTKGDVSNYANDKHLFWGVKHPDVDVRLVELEPKETLTAKQAHGWRHFDAPERAYMKRVFHKGEDLNRELDNNRRGEDVIWYENMRLLWGSYILYPIFFVWSRILQALERYVGLNVLRRTPRVVNSR